MLHEFLTEHRSELLAACQGKIQEMPHPPASEEELEESIPEFFDEIVAALRVDDGLQRQSLPTEPAKSAGVHGRQRHRLGFNITGVVHDYGSLCDSITDCARTYGIEISAREFQILNQSLDDGIAQAVSEYAEESSRQRDEEADRRATEHLGFVAHELRNALSTAILSFEAIRRGHVGIGGRTSDVLERSLVKLRSLIDRSLAEVRLRSGMQLERQSTDLDKLLDEIRAVGLLMDRHPIDLSSDPHLICSVDPQLVASAVTNLVQNAIRYSAPGRTVHLRASRTGSGVRIEVEDECGGVPSDKQNLLFSPFSRGQAGGGGLGLGLSICRQAAEAHGGEVKFTNLPGRGCIFSILLPNCLTEPDAAAPPPPTVH